MHLGGEECKLENKYLSTCFAQQDFQKAEDTSEKELFPLDKQNSLTFQNHSGENHRVMMGIPGNHPCQEVRETAHLAASLPYTHRGTILNQEHKDLLSELLSVLAILDPKEDLQIQHFFFLKNIPHT